MSPEEATRLREYRSKLAAWAKEGRNYKKNEWTRHADRRIKNRFEELNTDMFKSKKSIRQDSWNSYKRSLGSLQGDIDFHLESFRLGDKKNTTLYHWGTDQEQEFKGPKPNNPTNQPTPQKPAQPTQTTQQPKPATQTTAPTNNSAPKLTQPTTPSTPKPTQTNTGGGSSLINNKPKTSGGLVGFAKKNPRTTAMGALGLAAIGTGVLAYNKNKQKKKDEQVKSSY